MIRFSLLLAIVGLLVACAVPDGATPTPKIAIATGTLYTGEMATYRGSITPRVPSKNSFFPPLPLRFEADVKVANVVDAADVCATRTDKPIMRPSGSSNGVGTLYCANGYTIPVDINPYPRDSGVHSGFIIDPDGVAVGWYLQDGVAQRSIIFQT